LLLMARRLLNAIICVSPDNYKLVASTNIKEIQESLF